MEMLIDTHSHLYGKSFIDDEAEVIARAREVVSHIFLPAIDSESIHPIRQMAAQYPEFCYPMAGLHPCHVKANFKEELYKAEIELATGNYVGVGEAGIDLYWDKTTLNLQKQALTIQAAWAKEKQLPLILHSREAFTETIEIIEKAQDGRLFGVFHCFAGDVTAAKRAIDAGFKLGIGGVVTYKNNGGLDAVIKHVGLQNIVLETDAPYLTPVPFRGKRNESSYIKYVAEKIALILETDFTTVAEVTSKNALQLFRMAN